MRIFPLFLPEKSTVPFVSPPPNWDRKIKFGMYPNVFLSTPEESSMTLKIKKLRRNPFKRGGGRFWKKKHSLRDFSKNGEKGAMWNFLKTSEKKHTAKIVQRWSFYAQIRINYSIIKKKIESWGWDFWNQICKFSNVKPGEFTEKKQQDYKLSKKYYLL